MRAVRSKDTKPEMVVRQMLHSLGFRYRLHRKDLPGKPDIVFPGKRKIVLVHGCFWHGHDCKRGARAPKENADYWRQKIARNRERDAAQLQKLDDLGWQVLIVWECELKKLPTLSDKIQQFLKDS
jgi:DNA mismatch endonuclease (patch repair protein)